MQVFISHSSKDKWAARRVSEDLVDLGCTTFLDEKDIKSGASIDDSIRQNLKSCEDFLIILSPASVKSEWVLLELGGAMALQKNIVPILLYVGSNEIPNAISLRLARDINDIGQYYSEIQEKLGATTNPGNKTRRKNPTVKKRKSEYLVGTKVRITNVVPGEYIREEGPSVGWELEMETYLGRHATITHVEERDVVKLDVDNGKWYWGTPWLIIEN